MTSPAYAAENLDTTVSESPCTECERLRAELPIVRTVGDLTARHYDKRVRLGGGTEGHLSRLSLDEWGRLDLTLVSHHAGLRRTNEWININPDTPCEVLP